MHLSSLGLPVGTRTCADAAGGGVRQLTIDRPLVHFVLCVPESGRGRPQLKLVPDRRRAKQGGQIVHDFFSAVYTCKLSASTNLTSGPFDRWEAAGARNDRPAGSDDTAVTMSRSVEDGGSSSALRTPPIEKSGGATNRPRRRGQWLDSSRTGLFVAERRSRAVTTPGIDVKGDRPRPCRVCGSHSRPEGARKR